MAARGWTPGTAAYVFEEGSRDPSKRGDAEVHSLLVGERQGCILWRGSRNLTSSLRRYADADESPASVVKARLCCESGRNHIRQRSHDIRRVVRLRTEKRAASSRTKSREAEGVVRRRRRGKYELPGEYMLRCLGNVEDSAGVAFDDRW